MEQLASEAGGMAWWRKTHRPRSAAVHSPDTDWPARGECGPGDSELVRDLGLKRPPYHLDRQEQTDLLERLLDLELTCRRYPTYGEIVRALLRRIMEE